MRKRRQLLRDVELGRPAPLGRTPTLGKYLLRWLDRVAGEVTAGHIRPRTGDSYRDLLEHHVLPTSLAKVKLNALSVDDVRAWQRAKLAEPSSRVKAGEPPKAAVAAHGRDGSGRAPSRAERRHARRAARAQRRRAGAAPGGAEPARTGADGGGDRQGRPGGRRRPARRAVADGPRARAAPRRGAGAALVADRPGRRHGDDRRAARPGPRRRGRGDVPPARAARRVRARRRPARRRRSRSRRPSSACCGSTGPSSCVRGSRRGSGSTTTWCSPRTSARRSSHGT